MSTPFSAEQLRLLDKLLDEAGAGKAADRIPRRGGDLSRAELSFGQERLYIVERMRPGSAMYVGSGALRLRGDLDADALRRSLAFLVDRHEVLRTGLEENGDRVEQVVHPAGSLPLELPLREVTGDEVTAEVTRAASEGFDLARPPLLRATLLRVTDAEEPEWVLVLCVHHIVVDGWSLGLLMGEMGAVYAALASGEEPKLPEPSLQYADFAVWQRARLEQGVLTEQMEFWRGELAGLPSNDIPTDRPRPAERTYAGGTAPITLPAELVARLRGLTDQSQATLFMALVAAWSTVLGRWSGDDDVIVGTPMAGRRHAELEDVVGFFVNTLPLRVRQEHGDTFRGLLLRTREVCNRAQEHQDVPFERIIHELQPDRDVSGQTALARHWLALHNTPPVAFSAPGLDCQVLPALVGTVRCDLSVQLAPDGDGGLAGWLEYSTELYDASTARRLATAFETVLAAVTADPDLPVGALPVLGDEELAQVLQEFSNAGTEPLTGPALPQWFEARADATPDAVAVTVDETGESLTYAELDGRANQVAHLLAERGIGPEDRVAVCLHRGVALLPAVLGVFKAGAVYLPLDPDYPRARLDQLVEDGRPSLVLTSADLVGHFPGQRRLDVTGSEVSRRPLDRPEPARTGPDSAAYLLFTSGSTGRPKGVVNTHRGLLNRLHGMQRDYRLAAGDRVLQKTPLGFDVSLWELLWPLVTGATVVTARPGGHRDVEYLHEILDRHRVTLCHFVPSMLAAFLDTPDGGHESLRVLLSGGEELPAALAGRVLERYPHAELHNQYGPTEAVIDVTAGRVTTATDARVPIGRPVPGVELYVLDDAGRPQPVGVPGQLYIGGAQTARGYLDRPGPTAAAFVPHPFATGQRLYATGDLAHWRPDGTVEFRGRADGQVKIRGNRVETGEIEAVLRAHPDLTGALVTAHPDEDGRPQLVGYVTGEARVPAVQEYLRERLPEAMVPTHLMVLDGWPLSDHGKLDLSALPRPDGARQAAGPEHTAPRTPTEEAVAQICAELLKVERLGVYDSFFDLGGHSLLAIRAIARIRSNLGVGLRIGQFLQAPTVAALAVLVDEQLQAQQDGEQRDGGAQPGAAAPIPRVDRGAQSAAAAPIPRIDRGTYRG
ncbi:amino acid adenylation domain-containing protein [Streptomyces sp. ISL-36]|uniref:non-ribosomal peptide synthetase n=1 Tax=Streptomyces sp. ISL-36 TaxID=2819182 RepID=UPI001BE9462A|nr:non-ribosomal peptide synthetase [Streptomyces sp. ISL-36]MBT2440927.1 amino acid adenylation domain-containing protein [Streptomyces sp. ISL-36]